MFCFQGNPFCRIYYLIKLQRRVCLSGRTFTMTLTPSRSTVYPTRLHVCPAKTLLRLRMRAVSTESSLGTLWLAKDPLRRGHLTSLATHFTFCFFLCMLNFALFAYVQAVRFILLLLLLLLLLFMQYLNLWCRFSTCKIS